MADLTENVAAASDSEPLQSISTSPISPREAHVLNNPCYVPESPRIIRPPAENHEMVEMVDMVDGQPRRDIDDRMPRSVSQFGRQDTSSVRQDVSIGRPSPPARPRPRRRNYLQTKGGTLTFAERNEKLTWCLYTTIFCFIPAALGIGLYHVIHTRWPPVDTPPVQKSLPFIVYPPPFAHRTVPIAAPRPLTLDDVLGDRFRAAPVNGTWRGTEWLHRNVDGALVLLEPVTGAERVLLPADYPGLNTSRSHQVSADERFVLLEHEADPIYADTRSALYSLHPLHDWHELYNNGMNVTLPPIEGRRKLDRTRHEHCAFGPRGSQLVVVNRHSIYYYPDADADLFSGEHNRPVLIVSGTDRVSNGLADWMSVEEGLSDRTAMWFSPAGRHLAYVRFDHSRVETYQMAWRDGPNGPTGCEQTLVGPRKPSTHYLARTGTPNPVASLHVVDLGALPDKAVEVRELPVPTARWATEPRKFYSLLAAVRWVNEKTVVAVWMNREQSRASVYSCEWMTAFGWFQPGNCREITTIISSSGWLHMPQPLFSVNSPQLGGVRMVFIQPLQWDIPSGQGHRYNQLVTYRLHEPYRIGHHRLFARINVDRIVHWDAVLNVIFYLGNMHTAPQCRHLFAVHADFQSASMCLTCKRMRGHTHFAAHFGPKYVLIESQGPAVPRQDVYEWMATHDYGRYEIVLRYVREIQANEALEELVERVGFVQPQFIDVPDIGRVRMLVPSTKSAYDSSGYQLMVQPYGRPDTYLGTSEWRVELADYLVLNRSMIVAQVDVSGSSRRGVWNSHAVYRKLGTAEAADIQKIVRHLVRTFHKISADRVAIWGDGYAGYLTTMAVFSGGAYPYSCAAAVSPLSDWGTYLSLFSERFMGPMAGVNDTVYMESNATVAVDKNAAALAAKPFVTQFMMVHDMTAGNRTKHYKWSTKLSAKMLEKNFHVKEVVYSEQDILCKVWVKSHYFNKLLDFFERCLQENKPVIEGNKSMGK